MSVGIWDEQAILFPEIALFRDALGRGRLCLPRCRACGAVHWYPRAICPFCDTTDIEWTDSAGRGRIYSWTGSGSGPERRIVAYVTLDEGVTLTARIRPGRSGAVAIGQVVELIVDSADQTAPGLWFRSIE
jgi:uncharacterized OB-fold protein